MIFALWDYLNYRRRTGNYGDDPSKNFMALGHYNAVPPDVVALLEEGDALLTQRLDSLWSWGTMYLGGAPIDHLAVYVGHGRVLHMTLEGSRTHSLAAISKGARVLPVRLLYDQFPKSSPESDVTNHGGTDLPPPRWLSHRLPPKLQIVWAGLRIFFGQHPDAYQWKFFLDFLALLAAIYLAFGALVGPTLFVVAAAIFTTVIFNQATLQVKRKLGLRFRSLSHPRKFLYVMQRGALLFVRDGLQPNDLTRWHISADKIFRFP